MGTWTAIPGYMENVQGMHAVWIPQGPIDDSAPTIIDAVTQVLALAVLIRVVVVAPTTWWHASNFQGLHTPHPLPWRGEEEVLGPRARLRHGSPKTLT